MHGKTAIKLRPSRYRRFEGEGGTTAVDLEDPNSPAATKRVSEDIFEQMHDGSVVIAAITSCTNTSNPSVMMAAGLLAKKAMEKGLNAQAVGEDFSGSRFARGD